jgi:hypothetical protein
METSDDESLALADKLLGRLITSRILALAVDFHQEDPRVEDCDGEREENRRDE